MFLVNQPAKSLKKSLTVVCDAGLCNRIIALVSGLLIAKHTSRDFRMCWPRTKACSASFHELFSNDWQVEENDINIFKEKYTCYDGWRYLVPNLLEINAENITIFTHTSLISTRLYPQHQELLPEYFDLLNQLTPTQKIQKQIEDFRNTNFRPFMIGVHLRRGDFVSSYPESAANLKSALLEIDRISRENLDSGILLCTDDGAPNWEKKTQYEGLKETFKKRYGGRVVWHEPSNLVRSSPEAIIDAVVDLFLLRSVNALVGTYGSTFSVLSAAGRDVEAIFCRGDLLATQIERIFLRVTGLKRILKNIGKDKFGRNDIDEIRIRKYYTRKIVNFFSSFLKGKCTSNPMKRKK